MRPIITLTTDFRTRDGFVAQMKGVILGINSEVEIVDVTHDIEPFNILEAALVLKGINHRFPQGTIHVAVVDPGVGSTRRGIAVRATDRIYVGPDNGLPAYMIADSDAWEAREIRNSDYMSVTPHPTFHGRDIFAPVGAHLSRGRTFDTVGPVIHDPVLPKLPRPEFTHSDLQGEIIYIDRFGNLSSNIEASMIPQSVAQVRVGDVTIDAISRFFGEAEPGKAVALINSFGLLEIAVNRGNAKETLGVGIGDPVRVIGVSER